ncbi:MAG TPA: hypothetical protein VGD69_12745 [Herpetosiphonaceae bacterium]
MTVEPEPSWVMTVGPASSTARDQRGLGAPAQPREPSGAIDGQRRPIARLAQQGHQERARALRRMLYL